MRKILLFFGVGTACGYIISTKCKPFSSKNDKNSYFEGECVSSTLNSGIDFLIDELDFIKEKLVSLKSK